MTDATREQINKQMTADALKWWKNNDGPEHDPDGSFEDAYLEGEQHQHQISFEARRKDAIEEILNELRYSIDLSTHPQECQSLINFEEKIKELEKMKR